MTRCKRNFRKGASRLSSFQAFTKKEKKKRFFIVRVGSSLTKNLIIFLKFYQNFLENFFERSVSFPYIFHKFYVIIFSVVAYNFLKIPRNFLKLWQNFTHFLTLQIFLEIF